LFFIQLAHVAEAQISTWQLGGGGLSWSENDTTRLFIDFDSTPGAIQPTYFTLDATVFSHIDNWAFWRDPSDRIFDYLDGEMPRMWKWNNGIPDPSENGSWLIDADPSTSTRPRPPTWRRIPSPWMWPCRCRRWPSALSRPAKATAPTAPR